MDRCIKQDCVDFDVSKEDMDLTGNCNICNRNRQNPKWVSSDDQFLKLDGKIVNPTADVPAADTIDVPVTFTPIPVMKDRRLPEKKFIPVTDETIDVPWIEEEAEISEEVCDALSNSPLSAGFAPTGAVLSACVDIKAAEDRIVEPIIQALDELNEETKDIKDSGKRTEFSTGAVRDAQGGKGRFDLLPNMAVWALAHHTEKGCEKYGDRNWEKGIPIKNFIDSAKRHLTEFELGLSDENHMAAALWNIACCYETLLKIDMGILPESLDDDLAYPLRGVIDDAAMVMPWDRLRHPKLKI